MIDPRFPTPTVPPGPSPLALRLAELIEAMVAVCLYHADPPRPAPPPPVILIPDRPAPKAKPQGKPKGKRLSKGTRPRRQTD